MPRTLSRVSQLYVPSADDTPRIYGPYSVDSFTNATTTGLRWIATVEGWPADPLKLLFKVRLAWDNGGAITSWIFGSPRDQQGNLLSQVGATLDLLLVPDANGQLVKAATVGGSIAIEVHTAVQTTLSLEALR